MILQAYVESPMYEQIRDEMNLTKNTEIFATRHIFESAPLDAVH